MEQLLKVLKIYHEKLDQELRITPHNPDFWAYLDLQYPENPVELIDVFPEIIGVEEDIKKIAASGEGKYFLPFLHRKENYMHLTIVPECGADCALIAVEDITDDTGKIQTVTQKKNEISLLKKKIEEKNNELRDANKKLDSLMNIIRSQNHNLEMKVRKRTKQLNDSRLSIITTLAQAAEFRDMDTGGHIYRIGRSCVILGKKYGLSSKDCESLFYSSLLHDLGKIGIPDSILLKPGPLTDKEWALMREHTTIGAKLLSNNEHLMISSARDVALYHHEKWDGTGYPYGLSGEKIPLLGRICAIADVFDALLSERPYKESFTPEKSVDIILSGSGKHFDPDIVNIFRDVLDDILRLQKETAEDLEFLTPDF
ncbi:MAG: HD domain-containing phosphohydrolase [Spirochaetia bacterium]|jgi:HD-GYP domain-containing protein (c-di-GMP phosphodiesterase class II)|nr:HD domain-containing phosphohydrolase [Spirochaetia bacterium]